VILVLQGMKASKEFRVILVLKGILVPLEQKEKLVTLVLQDRMEKRVILVLKVNKV
jgi:hypothetical protein